jgi:hypothetical protein
LVAQEIFSSINLWLCFFKMAVDIGAIFNW